MLGKVLGPVFGRLQWTPPPWLAGMVSRPWILLLLLLLVGAGLAAYYWHLAQPQPFTVGATVIQTEPKLGKSNAKPKPISIDFGPSKIAQAMLAEQAAKQAREIAEYGEVLPSEEKPLPSSYANIKLLEKNLESGISIRPKMEGNWRWLNDKRLEFYPANHWPADTEFTVQFEPQIFNPDIALDDDSIAFRTPAFRSKLHRIRFYQDPADSEQRKVVATLHFSHPVDKASLKKNLQLTMRADGAGADSEPERYDFILGFGRNDHIAHVHSSQLSIPGQSTVMRLLLPQTVSTTRGGATLVAGNGKQTEKELKALPADVALQGEVAIPDARSYFQIKKAWTRIVDNEQGNPDQILFVELTDHATAQSVFDAMKLYQLPKSKRSNGRWKSAKEVGQPVLAESQAVKLHPLPLANKASNLHSFRYQLKPGQQLFLQFAQGMQSANEFALNKRWQGLLKVPAYPQVAKLQSPGALLSASGDRKLRVVSRGVPRVKVTFAQVPTEHVNQLISQTRGDISKAEFRSYQFNETDFAHRWAKTIRLRKFDPRLPSHSIVDVGYELDKAKIKSGLFIITVEGVNVRGHTVTGRDRRLVLLTDLALLAKQNADQSRELFIQRINEGGPAAGVNIQLLGRNGQVLRAGQSDAAGHWRLNNVQALIGTSDRAKEPTVFVVKSGQDLAFLPFDRVSRRLDLSRFDIGGLHSRGDGQKTVRAFVFSDRGLYRPGEDVHLSSIIKQQDFASLAGMPAQLQVHDPRGAKVMDQRLVVDETGLNSAKLQTADYWATGVYRVKLRRKHGGRWRVLGDATFRVEEFQPDTMKIRAKLEPKPQPKGWLRSQALKANIELQNLFGAPAQNRKVTAHLRLSPSQFHFGGALKHYQFIDPYLDPTRQQASHAERLPEQMSDKAGNASFDLGLQRFAGGTWRVTVQSQGYEPGEGRSVSTAVNALVSPAEYLIGSKADGALNYIRQDAKREVSLLAVDERLQARAVPALQQRLIREVFISTLVRQGDGTMAYQSLKKDELVWIKPLAMGAAAQALALDTSRPGDYRLEVVDAGTPQRLRARVAYSVVGAANLNAQLEKNAELQVKLDQTDYKAGDDIELQIRAPYTGSGLITIEADKVYAWRWFKADTTNSVQTIKVPKGMEANAYVNVTFLRSVDSPEVFSSPLSYAAVPFKLNRKMRELQMSLDVPERVKPGQTLDIGYLLNQPAKVVLMAVDEGILQVANHPTPKPLDYFLSKRALQVRTQQMLDLLLPEYHVLRQASAAGGGDMERKDGRRSLNPFARKAQAPVAFFSGVLEASGSGRWRVKVPDYFNGAVRITAVAVNANSIGVERQDTQVRGDLIFQPNVLSAMAPGDEFTVTTGLSNLWQGSGAQLPIKVELQAGAGLQVVGDARQTVTLDEDSETTLSWQVQAQQAPQATALVFKATAEHVKLGLATASLKSTTSIRPATVAMTTLQTGYAKDGQLQLPLPRQLYAERGSNRVAASPNPLVLANGLTTYLDNYSHACTEQLISRGLPALALWDQPELLLNHEEKQTQLEQVVRLLRSRQRSNGAFTQWPGYAGEGVFPSLYASHFLLELNEQQRAGTLMIAPVDDLLRDAMGYVKQLAAKNHRQQSGPSGKGLLGAARWRAYAIYLLSRHRQVTTNYLVHLQEELEKQYPKGEWRADILAVYMAASYQLLQKDDEAQKLLSAYKPAARVLANRSVYDSRLAHDAAYVYLLAQHFPQAFKALNGEVVEGLLNPLFDGQYNTTSAAMAVLALDAYAQRLPGAVQAISIDAVDANGQPVPQVSAAEPNPFIGVQLGIAAASVTAKANQPLFWQLNQSGFDLQMPAEPVRAGLELFREYLDDKGKPINAFKRGQEVTVRLRIRALDGPVSEVAIVDLLPAGFEIQRQSVRGQGWDGGYSDIREDRIVLYRHIGQQVQTYQYKVVASAAGKFTLPAAYAEAMYEPAIRASAAGGVLSVE